MSWLFLKGGRTLASVLVDLAALRVGLDEIKGRLSAPTARPAADAYVRWVESAEKRLRLAFDGDSSIRLFDERYWRIREIHESSVRPIPLIESAIEHHLFRLDEMESQLRGYESACGPDGSTIAILDTNVYDHYQLFTQIPWTKILKAKSVRLLVPLVVVDELDWQKDNSERLARRAGKVIRTLRGLPYVSGSSGPRTVGPSIELDYLHEPSGHARSNSNDDEIVRQTAYIASIAPDRVMLVTGDLGMQVRATNAGLPHHRLADNYLSKSEGDA